MNYDSQISDRLSFLLITADDRRNLQMLWSSIESALPRGLDRFYRHVRGTPHLAALVGQQQDRLVAAQSEHWKRLFSGTFDAAYVESIKRIGNIHHRIGLEPRWYIGGYAFVLNELVAHSSGSIGSVAHVSRPGCRR